MMNANIEGIKRLRKIAIVGCVTKYELAGNYILGKRGYVKLMGWDSHGWMKLEEFEDRYKHYGICFFNELDKKEGPFFVMERAAISNTNAYAMWVCDGIYTNEECAALLKTAREDRDDYKRNGWSFVDYRCVARFPKRAFAESERGYDEYDKECQCNGYANDQYDDEDEEDYSE